MKSPWIVAAARRTGSTCQAANARITATRVDDRHRQLRGDPESDKEDCRHEDRENGEESSGSWSHSAPR